MRMRCHFRGVDIYSISTMLLAKKLLILTIPVIFAFCLIVNYVSSQVGFGKDFITIKNVSEFYNNPLIPAKWGFIIWTIIYVWQTALILFLLVSFVIVVAGMRLYEYPFVFSYWFLGSYLASFVFSIAWTFVFEYSIYSVKLLPLTIFLTFATSGALYMAIVVSYRDFVLASDDGFHKDNFLISWHVRIIVHNGLNIYAAWTTVVQFVILSAGLIYFNKVNVDTACIVSISILLVLMLIYYCLDLILLDKYTRYVLTPHLVLVWAFSAIISRNYKAGNALSILTMVILALAFGMLVVKIVVTTIRHRKEEREGYDEMAEARRIL